MASTKNTIDEQNYLKEINDFKDDIKKQAESLVLKTFPRKVLELQNILNNAKFNLKNLDVIKSEINVPVPEYPYTSKDLKDGDINGSVNEDLVGEDGDRRPMKKRKYIELSSNSNNHTTTSSGSTSIPIANESTTSNSSNSSASSSGALATTFDKNDGCRVLVLPYGTVPCNKYLVELIDMIKPLIRQLVDDSNLLKMWILFLIPRIEDGNNFGVSIQEDTLSEIRTVEAEAAAYFDQLSRYFLSRAKTVTKIAKYPHVEDFRRTVAEIDEKEFTSLRLIVCELRNHYASLHDIVTKNLEKIKIPRTSNNGSMY